MGRTARLLTFGFFSLIIFPSALTPEQTDSHYHHGASRRSVPVLEPPRAAGLGSRFAHCKVLSLCSQLGAHLVPFWLEFYFLSGALPAKGISNSFPGLICAVYGFQILTLMVMLTLSW